MMEFLSSYGLWLALAAIMIGMHWFGMGCCGGGRRHSADRQPMPVAGDSTKNAKRPGEEEDRGSSCH